MIKKSAFQIISNKQVQLDPFNIEDESDSQKEDPNETITHIHNEEKKQQLNNQQEIKVDSQKKTTEQTIQNGNILKKIVGKKIENNIIYYLVEKVSKEKAWKKLKVLISKGYSEEIEDYEKFVKERLEISLFKLNDPEIQKSSCYYIKRHIIKKQQKEFKKKFIKGKNYSTKYENFDRSVAKVIEERLTQEIEKKNAITTIDEEEQIIKIYLPFSLLDYEKMQMNNQLIKIKSNQRLFQTQKSTPTQLSNSITPSIATITQTDTILKDTPLPPAIPIITPTNIVTSSEEPLKKSEEDSLTNAPAVIQIRGFEQKDDGIIMFSIEENDEKKYLKLEEIEKNYPKQLAQYLYDLLNQQ